MPGNFHVTIVNTTVDDAYAALLHAVDEDLHRARALQRVADAQEISAANKSTDASVTSSPKVDGGCCGGWLEWWLIQSCY